MTPEDFLRRMPKVELHCHLEGSVPPETVIRLAREHGVALPTEDPDRLYRFDSLESFLEVYALVCTVMTTGEDFREVARESLIHAADGANVRYREISFNPTNHRGLSYREMVDGLIAGMRDAFEACGIRTRLIPAINREQPAAVAHELLSEILRNPREEIVGIGMDHNERMGPPAKFREVYDRAADAGLRRTAHAGERGSSAEILDSLDLLDCERIDHGYAIVADDAALARVGERDIHFATTWGSAVFHHPSNRAENPIGRMAAAGLDVSLSSDDPAMIPTDLARDYVSAATTLGWQPPQLVAQCRAALDASWLSDDDKRTLRHELDEETDALMTLLADA